MIAVTLGAVVVGEWNHLCRAHHHVDFAGRGIHIHQLAAIEIAQVLAVGRPVELCRRLGDQSAVRKDCLNGELAILRLCRARMRSQRQGCENGNRKSSATRQ
jgi:hypothetical protein